MTKRDLSQRTLDGSADAESTAVTDKRVVLVAGDKSPILEFKNQLKQNGIEVKCTSGGFDALAELYQGGADILVADSHMKDLGGCQLSCILKSSARTSRLPVLLLNQEGADSHGFWQIAAQADAVLEAAELKSVDKLIATIRDLLEKGRQSGWQPGMLKSAGGHSSSFSSANPAKSYEQLANNLMVERLISNLTYNLLSVIEPRKRFLDRYFEDVSRLFDCQAYGFIVANASNPWASFKLTASFSKKSFEDQIKKISRQLEIHKDLNLDVRGMLADESGSPMPSPEVLPVSGEQGILGALLFAAGSKKGFGEDVKSAMQQLQVHMQPVMRLLLANQEIEMLNQKEQYRASTDSLTGLYNLEFLVGFLQQQLLFSFRQRAPVGLIIIDIDSLKAVNDEFGYEMGDLSLSTIAHHLLNQTRSSDLIARYGGDELAIVLPNTDVAGTRVVAEKVRLEVEQMSFVKGSGRKGPRITVSVGCAEFNMEDLNPETILRDAKMALQRAKQAGGNRVST